MEKNKLEWNKEQEELALRILKKYPKEFKAIGRL
jgi:hypothetical protein